MHWFGNQKNSSISLWPILITFVQKVWNQLVQSNNQISLNYPYVVSMICNQKMTILIKLYCTLFQRKDDFWAKAGNFGHSQQYVTFTYICLVGNRWLRGQKSHESKSLDDVVYRRRAEKDSLRSANNLSQLSWGTPFCSRFWTHEVFVLEAISCLPNNFQLEFLILVHCVSI